MKTVFILVIFATLFARADAQSTGGHLYGRVVGNSGPLSGATIEVLHADAAKPDSFSVVRTLESQSNGDFSVEDLPATGRYRLLLSFEGYKDKTLNAAFALNHTGGSDATQLAQVLEKDLGNVKMDANPTELANVTIVAKKPLFEMGVDRKIFNVENNIVTSGQTATELMRNIPGVNVDVEGNVTLRNATPTIFMDGRPTTLTLDQIPADLISRVELVTNPSAKYDASGGNASILNIVMKKNTTPGYNGGLRGGIDSRSMLNGGADGNLRAGKVNLFASGMYHQRQSIGTSNITRNGTVPPYATVLQQGNANTKGHFGYARFGADYFIDNRNTLTFTQTIGGGAFNNSNSILIDSLAAGTPIANGTSTSYGNNTVHNAVSSLDFKHTYPRAGKEWSGFVTYNSSRGTNASQLQTQFVRPDKTNDGTPLLQNTTGSGTNRYYTAQTDYTDPVSKHVKLEWGLRAAVRDFSSNNANSFFDPAQGTFVPSAAASSNYSFHDEVYAGYGTFTNKLGEHLQYQLGLRGESSNYTGQLTGTGQSFHTAYPISLFPSSFVTWQFDTKKSLQFNYSRRVTRPSFFQLLPFTDYSNPQNLTVGNAGLKPSFTNSLEANYDQVFNARHSLLASAYYKSARDLITAYQYPGANPITGEQTIYSTYVNADKSRSYGLELTSKNTVARWWDALVNLNLYNARIDAGDNAGATSSERWSWFAKVNNTFRLPLGMSVQLSGDYQSRSVLPQTASNSGGKGANGGGTAFGASTLLSAQGYVNDNWGVDAALRKDFGPKKALSATASVNDLFRTRLYSYYSETPFYTQTYDRTRDQQVFRLNLAYHFGKLDTGLLKRRNNKNADAAVDENGN